MHGLKGTFNVNLADAFISISICFKIKTFGDKWRRFVRLDVVLPPNQHWKQLKAPRNHPLYRMTRHKMERIKVRSKLSRRKGQHDAKVQKRKNKRQTKPKIG